MRTWIAKLSLCGALGLLTLSVAGEPRALAAKEPPSVAKEAKVEKAREDAAAVELTDVQSAGHEEHEAKGVPLDFKSDLAFWSGIVFVIFLFVLGRYAWKPLIAALDEREGKIRGDISAAESARTKAEQMLAEHAKRMAQVHEEVREALAEARRDAERLKQEIVAQAQKEAQAAKDRAVHEISRARDSALKDLFDVMAGEVAQATRHVLGRSVNAADQDRLIEEALAQFPRRS
jgi:F-type H+-transporting ATPase subunit b